MGLTITRNLLHAHSADIALTPGATGTTLTLTFYP